MRLFGRLQLQVFLNKYSVNLLPCPVWIENPNHHLRRTRCLGNFETTDTRQLTTRKLQRRDNMPDNIMKSLSAIIGLMLTLSVSPADAGAIFGETERPPIQAGWHGDGDLAGFRLPGVKDPRYYQIWFEAVLHVTDETGTPIAGADVWRTTTIGDDLTIRDDRLLERTDEKGEIEYIFYYGDHLEVYFAGRKAVTDIDERRESYSVTLPLRLDDPREDVPGVVVSATHDNSEPKRLLVAISGDPLASKPEVTLFQHYFYRPRYSCPISMVPMEENLWSGAAEYEYDEWGILEVTTPSESGSSLSASPFRICEVRPTESALKCHSPQTEELEAPHGIGVE